MNKFALRIDVMEKVEDAKEELYKMLKCKVNEAEFDTRNATTDKRIHRVQKKLQMAIDVLTEEVSVVKKRTEDMNRNIHEVRKNDEANMKKDEGR